MVFLASHRAAGHISGECLSVDGGQEGRIVWREQDTRLPSLTTDAVAGPPKRLSSFAQGVPSTLPSTKKMPIKVALSVDFDAVSGWLGTGGHTDNNMADYSAGIFSGKVGVSRLLKLFTKLGVADKMTWFIPGHSMETFPEETMKIIASGCEIGLHGYSHEGAGQLTVEQERDVVLKCIELATTLVGKRPIGWRAPLYQIREETYSLLEEEGFEYGGFSELWPIDRAGSNPSDQIHLSPVMTPCPFSPHAILPSLCQIFLDQLPFGCIPQEL